MHDDEIAWRERQHENWRLADDLRAHLEAGRHADAGKIQVLLRRRFGEIHGWQRSPARFTVKSLACGDRKNRLPGLAGEDADAVRGRLFDHPGFWRRGGNAAAISAHLYHWPDYEERCRAFAAEHRLDVREVDFPSWWFPGATTLILWTGAIVRAERDEQARLLAESCATSTS